MSDSKTIFYCIISFGAFRENEKTIYLLHLARKFLSLTYIFYTNIEHRVINNSIECRSVEGLKCMNKWHVGVVISKQP